MPNQKPLSEMSLDEIAALTPEQFQDLAHDHNDQTELAEAAYERVIADSNDPANYPIRRDPDPEIHAVLRGLVEPPPPNRVTVPQAVKQLGKSLYDTAKDVLDRQNQLREKEQHMIRSGLKPEDMLDEQDKSADRADTDNSRGRW